MSKAADIVHQLLEGDADLDPKDYIGQRGMWIEFGSEIRNLPTASGYYCAVKLGDEDWWFEGGWDNLEDAAEYYDSECGENSKIVILDAPNRRAQVVPYVRDTTFNSDPNGPKAGYIDFFDRFLHGS